LFIVIGLIVAGVVLVAVTTWFGVNLSHIVKG
jgi:hypothetical protein